MDALYNFSACALGQFAAYVYFSSRFELKRPRALGIVFPAAAAVQFALSFAGLAALNVAFMFACSLCAALIIYRINIKQALLHSALLEAFAAVSALAVLFAVPNFRRSDLRKRGFSARDILRHTVLHLCLCSIEAPQGHLRIFRTADRSLARLRRGYCGARVFDGLQYVFCADIRCPARAYGSDLPCAQKGNRKLRGSHGIEPRDTEAENEQRILCRARAPV